MTAAQLLKDIDLETAGLWPKQCPAGEQEERPNNRLEKIYWVPIRHHSPACAYALRKLIQEIRPEVILLEGPDDCQDLIPLCQHPETQTPVAFLTQKGEKQDLYTAFFPLCDYSPEWIAIRSAAEINARVQLIDLPYEAREDEVRDEKVKSLMEESYLAHSHYLQSISQQLGCRDHHESWDRLFEQRNCKDLGDWRAFFRDVYAYCSLARRDYDEAALKANGDYDREVYMARKIVDAVAQIKGACVVVTGGFHTPALMSQLETLANAAKKIIKHNQGDRNWMIRYSYDQLDALNGYGAGMPSPAYYQTVWRNLQQGDDNYLQETATKLLIAIAHDNREQKLTAMISSSEVQAAVFQTQQLASLRHCPGPGRSEIMDAVMSCYVKDSVDRNLGLLADARRVMCGDRLGAIPADTRQPPLLRETWERGQQLGLDFGHTHVKDIDLEIYKKPRHRAISRFFHLLHFCGVPLASWQAGPDFVSGSQTERIREHWKYAWTPSVESQLLEKVTLGTTLEAIALHKITEQENELEDSGNESRAKTAASLLLRACVMGMHDYVSHIAGQISRLIHDDEHITSLTGCGYHLLTLQNGQSVLEPEKLGLELGPLISQCWHSAMYLVPRLENLSDDDSEKGVQALRELYTFSGQVSKYGDEFYNALHNLVDSDQAAGAIRGAALGILFQSGHITQLELGQYLSRFLQQGQDPELVLGIIYGLISVAREVLWRVPGVLQHINQIMTGWSEEYFLQMLPSMRRLFSQLTPQEVDKVATELVTLNQLNVSPDALYETTPAFSEKELALMTTLDSFVESTLGTLGINVKGAGDE